MMCSYNVELDLIQLAHRRPLTTQLITKISFMPINANLTTNPIPIGLTTVVDQPASIINIFVLQQDVLILIKSVSPTLVCN